MLATVYLVKYQKLHGPKLLNRRRDINLLVLKDDSFLFNILVKINYIIVLQETARVFDATLPDKLLLILIILSKGN